MAAAGAGAGRAGRERREGGERAAGAAAPGVAGRLGSGAVSPLPLPVSPVPVPSLPGGAGGEPGGACGRVPASPRGHFSLPSLLLLLLMLFFLVTEPRLAFTLGILSPRAAPALTPFSARRKEPGKGEQPNGRELWFSSGWGISPSHPLDPARASGFIASPEKSLRPCWVSPPRHPFPAGSQRYFYIFRLSWRRIQGLHKLCQLWGGRSRRLAWSTPRAMAGFGGKATNGGFFEQGQQSKPFLSEFCPCPPGAAEEQLPLVAAETVPVAEPSKISEEWRISFGIQVVFCQTWLPGWE